MKSPPSVALAIQVVKSHLLGVLTIFVTTVCVVTDSVVEGCDSCRRSLSFVVFQWQKDPTRPRPDSIRRDLNVSV